MASYFRAEGLRAASVHTGEGADPRAQSLEKLQRGLARIIRERIELEQNAYAQARRDLVAKR